MTESDQVRVARNASEVLGNEAYQKAMADLKEQIIQQWKDCPVRDVEGQRLLLQLIKLADKFDGMLTGYGEAGNLAQHRVNLDNERNESMAQRVMLRSFAR